MKTAFAGLTAALLSSFVAAQPSADRMACVRPATPVAEACLQRASPQTMSLCLAQIEAAIGVINRHEQCVMDAMDKRHAKERAELTEDFQQRRESLLRTLQGMLR